GRLCADLHEERFLARPGYRLAMRGYLALIAIAVARLAASRARTGAATLMPADPTVDALRYLVEEHFRHQRQLAFYAGKLAMTPDRLNDHVKRAAGVTAGHLIRQRVLTEAKRQLVFTNQPIHEIAYDLTFADPSHFTRFFRKQTGITPQAFRERGGGWAAAPGSRPPLGCAGQKERAGRPRSVPPSEIIRREREIERLAPPFDFIDVSRSILHPYCIQPRIRNSAWASSSPSSVDGNRWP